MKQLKAKQMKMIFGGQDVIVQDPIVIEDPIDDAKKVVKFKAGSDLSNTVQ